MKGRERKARPPFAPKQLLSDVELVDDGAVALDVDLHQVAEQASSVTDHLKQSATAVMILVIRLEMLGEVVDAAGKKRDLNLGGAGIALMGGVLADNCLFFFCGHGFFTFHKIFGVGSGCGG